MLLRAELRTVGASYSFDQELPNNVALYTQLRPRAASRSQSMQLVMLLPYNERMPNAVNRLVFGKDISLDVADYKVDMYGLA